MVSGQPDRIDGICMGNMQKSEGTTDDMAVGTLSAFHGAAIYGYQCSSGEQVADLEQLSGRTFV